MSLGGRLVSLSILPILSTFLKHHSKHEWEHSKSLLMLKWSKYGTVSEWNAEKLDFMIHCPFMSICYVFHFLNQLKKTQHPPIYRWYSLCSGWPENLTPKLWIGQGHPWSNWGLKQNVIWRPRHPTSPHLIPPLCIPNVSNVQNDRIKTYFGLDTLGN